MRRLAMMVIATATLTMTHTPASANDLMKALIAISNASRGPALNTSTYGSGRYGSPYVSQPAADCDHRIEHNPRYASRELARQHALEHAEQRARVQRLERLEQARIAASHRGYAHTRFQADVPPSLPLPPQDPPAIPATPLPPSVQYPAPSPAMAPFGQIVQGDVPLYDRVRIRDRHNIARGARPMIVAVKAPYACRHACTCCNDKVVYVCVMAPPCEPQCVTVSKCGTHVRMDFGKYEIDIVTLPTLVKIDYDN